MTGPSFTEEAGQESRPVVKLIRNASGATQIEVRAPGDTLAGASVEAQRVYDELCARYPAAQKGAR